LGEWLYSHRIGLLVVLAVYLVGGVVLATARYDVELRPVEYIIEFVDEAPTEEEVEELKKRRDMLQEDINRRLAAIEKVKNLQSNDASESAGSKEQMQYDSDMQQMMDKVASDMATNRGDYESGMREVQGIGKGGSGGGSGGTKGDGDKGKFSGAVTVAYSFENPVRHHRDLYVPAYRSKSGGVVVVDVWLDRNGTVTSARISSSTNSELNEQALSAARNRRTLFRIDSSAPVSHRGTITYTFVAQ
jgi:TonB family protein